MIAKRGFTMLFETNWQEILEIITPILTVVGGAAGYGIAKFQEWKKLQLDQKKLDLQIETDEEKIDNERFRDTVTASQKLSEILINVVTPMSERIGLLESDSITKQKQILDLSSQVMQLTKTLNDKDMHIDDLNKRYKAQVEISNQQEKKIQAQALRIGELEEELNRMKKRKEV